jgi:hypothetical protein
LLKHGVVEGQKWIANIRTFGHGSTKCDLTTFKENFSLLRPEIHAAYIQRLGASGIIFGSFIYPIYKFSSQLPYFDSKTGVVLIDGPAQGAVIDIPLFVIPDIGLADIIHYNVGRNTSTTLYIEGEDGFELWSWIRPITGVSVYAITSYVVVSLGILCLLDLIRISFKYYFHHGKVPWTYNTCTLAVNLVAYPVKIAVAVDPSYGLLGVIPSASARPLSTLAQSLTAISLVVTLFSWIEILEAIGKSLEMQLVQGLHRKRKVVLVVFALLLLAMDLTLAMYEVYWYKVWAVNVGTIPLYFLLAINIIIGLFSAYTTISIRLMVKKIKSKVAPSLSAPPSAPHHSSATAASPTASAAVTPGPKALVKLDSVNSGTSSAGGGNKPHYQPLNDMYEKVRLKLERISRLMEINAFLLFVDAALQLMLQHLRTYLIPWRLISVVFGLVVTLLFISFIDVRIIEAILHQSSDSKGGGQRHQKPTATKVPDGTITKGNKSKSSGHAN